MVAAASTVRNEGCVFADAIYTLDEIKQRLGMGVHAMRMARRGGLKVKYVGNRGYVLGRDVISFVDGLEA